MVRHARYVIFQMAEVVVCLMLAIILRSQLSAGLD